MRHQLQLDIGHSSDYWAQGFTDGFNSLKTALSFQYPNLYFAEISVKKLFLAFNQPTSQPRTLASKTCLPLFNTSDVLINQEISHSLEIIEMDQGLLRANSEGVGENAPDPALNPSSPLEVIGPNGPLMILGDNLSHS